MPKNGFPVLEQPKFRNFMYFDFFFPLKGSFIVSISLHPTYVRKVLQQKIKRSQVLSFQKKEKKSPRREKVSWF